MCVVGNMWVIRPPLCVFPDSLALSGQGGANINQVIKPHIQFKNNSFLFEQPFSLIQQLRYFIFVIYKISLTQTHVLLLGPLVINRHIKLSVSCSDSAA